MQGHPIGCMGMGGYLVLWFVIEVIKEDATQAAPLIPVLAVEVLICPLLKPRVVLRVMLIAHALHCQD